MSGKEHPHIEKPSAEQISSVLEGRDPVLSGLYHTLHRLVLETLPDVVYSMDCKDGQMGYGARQYGYDGWGMAALSIHKKWVSLIFMRGADLDDQEQMLEGTGKRMRHVKIQAPEQLDERKSVLQRLVKEASKLNEE